MANKTIKEFNQEVINKIWKKRNLAYAYIHYGEQITIKLVLTNEEILCFTSDNEIIVKDFSDFKYNLHEEAHGCGLKHIAYNDSEVFDRF